LRWTETNKFIYYCVGLKQIIYLFLCWTETKKFTYCCDGLKQINVYIVALDWDK